MGIIHPTIANNIGYQFGTAGTGYPDRTWHGVFYTSFHGGIDYWGPLGYPIWSTANGVVLYAGYGVPYIGGAGGNGVVIQHGPYLKSIYGHMDTVTVAPGQALVAGQRIGTMGQSGVANGVNHLHFEIRTTTISWGEDVDDPFAFMDGGAQANSGLANDTSDIPWLEPLTGTLIMAALCNPLGGNQWATPTNAEAIIAVYFDRIRATGGQYTVSGSTITPIATLPGHTEVRADYTAA